MRLSQTLPLALLLLSCLESAIGRKDKENSRQVKPSSPWAHSGQFYTREKHLCSWQLISEDDATSLQLSCHQAGGDSRMEQQCIYWGQPELCAAYSSKGRQFWKQILGKLRRKRHPCQDSSPLQSRLCSSKKGAFEAQLRLIPSTSSTEAPVPTEAAAKGRSKGKGHPKDSPKLQKPSHAPQDRVIGNPIKVDALEKRSKGGKRKGTSSSSVAPVQRTSQQPTVATEGNEAPTEFNASMAETYCEEKWHSLCNFFVNFWNGWSSVGFPMFSVTFILNFCGFDISTPPSLKDGFSLHRQILQQTNEPIEDEAQCHATQRKTNKDPPSAPSQSDVQIDSSSSAYYK